MKVIYILVIVLVVVWINIVKFFMKKLFRHQYKRHHKATMGIKHILIVIFATYMLIKIFL